MLANDQGNVIPTVERDTPNIAAPHDEDTDMGGVEVPGGPELLGDDNEVTSQPPGEGCWVAGRQRTTRDAGLASLTGVVAGRSMDLLWRKARTVDC